MAAVVNPNKVTWQNPATYTDPTVPYGQADNAGYVVSIDNAAPIPMPGVVWATEFVLTGWAPYEALKSGTHTIGVAPVSKGGKTGAIATGSFSRDLTLLLAPAPVTALGFA